MFHSLNYKIGSIPLPLKLNSPFKNVVHPICEIAAKQVQHYLENELHLNEELFEGKMFGVLVVRNEVGEIGYLAAFSGLLNNKNSIPFFVPPIYDMLCEREYFKIEEKKISQINEEIRTEESNSFFIKAKKEYQSLLKEQEESILVFKQQMGSARIIREAKRQQPAINNEELSLIVKESQYQKAQYKRLKQAWEERCGDCKREVEIYTSKIEQLKEERKRKSASLQNWLFDQFIVLNAKKERKNLNEIFSSTALRIPPAGAGECAAPKLMQYALLRGYIPVSIAEFWWGKSPRKEIRHSRQFYEACPGKCLPILSFVLQGMEWEGDVLKKTKSKDIDIEILYEDSSIIVLKQGNRTKIKSVIFTA